MPEDTRSGAEGRREPDRGAVGVDDRDVRRPGRASAACARRHRRTPAASARRRPLVRREASRAALRPSPSSTASPVWTTCAAERRRRRCSTTAFPRRRLPAARARRLVRARVRREIGKQDRNRLRRRRRGAAERRDEIGRVDRRRPRAVDTRPPSSRCRIGTRISWRNACAGVASNGRAASSSAGMKSAAHGQATAPRVGLVETPHQPRHGDGRLADVEDLRRRVREVDHDLVHLAARAGRDGKEAIEDGRVRRPARRSRRKPPPAGPVSGPSVTKAGERRRERRRRRTFPLREAPMHPPRRRPCDGSQPQIVPRMQKRA